jgi:hypothetical protein
MKKLESDLLEAIDRMEEIFSANGDPKAKPGG